MAKEGWEVKFVIFILISLSFVGCKSDDVREKPRTYSLYIHSKTGGNDQLITDFYETDTGLKDCNLLKEIWETKRTYVAYCKAYEVKSRF